MPGHEPSPQSRWESMAPYTGFVAVAAFLVLSVLPGPDEDASAEEITRFFTDREWLPLVSFFVAAVGGAALLWFLGSLRAVLRRAEPEPGRLTTVATAAGAVLVVLLFAAGSSFLSAGGAIVYDDDFVLDKNAYDLVSTVGYVMFSFAMVGAAAMVAAVSLVSLRTGALPKWFAVSGFVVAVALFLSIIYFFGFYVFLLWLLIATILLLRRARPATLETVSASQP